MNVISPETHRTVASLPVRTLLRTDQSGWTSVLAHECEVPARMETTFETVSTPDPVIKLLLVESNRWFVRRSHGWRTLDVARGSLCFTRPGETHELRWHRPTDEALRMLHLYIPAQTLSVVADELGPSRRGWADATNTFFTDGRIADLISATAQAARNGVSDLYAQSAATLIAFHLLTSRAESALRTYDDLSDRRLLRVLDFIEAHYDQPLSLDLLAAEAGISRYHFAMVFKRSVGRSPHRYVHEVRLRCATAMLRSTEKSVFDIALSCGFASASHFAAAFRAVHGETPSAFRHRARSADR